VIPGASATRGADSSSGKFARVWAVAGNWTGVARDRVSGSIYALGSREHCAEIDASGSVVRTFDLNGADGTILRLARFKNEPEPALLTFHVWSWHVQANEAHGRLLWRYPDGDRHAIDDVSAADLDGDGSDEVVVGFNARGGLQVVDRKGTLLWRSDAVGDV
jgi:hypothetical protein